MYSRYSGLNVNWKVTVHNMVMFWCPGLVSSSGRIRLGSWLVSCNFSFIFNNLSQSSVKLRLCHMRRTIACTRLKLSRRAINRMPKIKFEWCNIIILVENVTKLQWRVVTQMYGYAMSLRQSCDPSRGYGLILACLWFYSVISLISNWHLNCYRVLCSSFI